ncbi:hypothetical protein M8C21_018831 [Ambrosia artemisiifolia]|uniref:Uncharacterized protein n=1 Tax=Ambrosia artemisiifolia TaxID=4212 RepID=A0AAD5CYK9_AMBAR|nr:hypothetical protein M8C21_018831 [Ambrosia artemisiifolia]
MEVETQQLSELQDCLMKLSSVLLNEDRDTWVWLGDDTGLYTLEMDEEYQEMLR